MSVQHERLGELCGELRLGAIANQYSALAQQAAERHSSFSDFREALLVAERESRRARAREMFARVAGFPAIKTLDQYDFSFATGAPRKRQGRYREVMHRAVSGYRLLIVDEVGCAPRGADIPRGEYSSRDRCSGREKLRAG